MIGGRLRRRTTAEGAALGCSIQFPAVLARALGQRAQHGCATMGNHLGMQAYRRNMVEVRLSLDRSLCLDRLDIEEGRGYLMEDSSV